MANIQIFIRIYRNFALICCFAAKEKVSWYWDSSVLFRAFDTLHEYCRQEAHLIIRMIFGFASDGICQTQPKWLQILRRQCCLPDNCPSNGDCSCVKSFLKMTSFSFPHELLLLRIFHSFIIFVASTRQCRFGINKSSFSRNRHREKYLHSWYSLAKTNDRETMSELTVFTKGDLTMVFTQRISCIYVFVKYLWIICNCAKEQIQIQHQWVRHESAVLQTATTAFAESSAQKATCLSQFVYRLDSFQ